MGAERCDISCVDVEDFKELMDKMNIDYTILNENKAIISKDQYDNFLEELM